MQAHASSVRILAAGKGEILVSGDKEGYINFFQVPQVQLPEPPPVADPFAHLFMATTPTDSCEVEAAAAAAAATTAAAHLGGLEEEVAAPPPAMLSATEFDASLAATPTEEPEVAALPGTMPPAAAAAAAAMAAAAMAAVVATEALAAESMQELAGGVTLAGDELRGVVDAASQGAVAEVAIEAADGTAAAVAAAAADGAQQATASAHDAATVLAAEAVAASPLAFGMQSSTEVAVPEVPGDGYGGSGDDGAGGDDGDGGDGGGGSDS